MHACLGCTTGNPPGDFMGYYCHVVRPDNHMTPLERGEKVNQCQEPLQLQTVYVPREELSCPDSARRSVLEDPRPSLSGMRPS